MSKVNTVSPHHVSITLHIISTTVTYSCINADKHFLNDPHGKTNTSNFPVPIPFNSVVYGIIIIMVIIIIIIVITIKIIKTFPCAYLFPP